MKRSRIFPILIIISGLFLTASSAHAEEVFFDPQLLPYGGKSYTGVQDPEYGPYSSALKDYMVKRIHQQFGVTLDPKTYSEFDLLEIEALLKCKKAEEPSDVILKMFPKYW
jgi:hypothetical protein